MPAASPFDYSHPVVLTGLFVLGLITLLGGLAAITTIWKNVRSSPPIANELAILKTQVASIEQRLTDAKKAIGDTEGRLERDLAKIEKELKEDRVANEGRFTLLFQKLDTFQGTLQNLSNEVLRSVGRLEGASTKMEQNTLHAAVAEAVSAAIHPTH